MDEFRDVKLEGAQNIADYLKWSRDKFMRRLPKLIETGIVFKDRVGSPPVEMWCSFTSLLQRYCMICGKNKEFI